MSSDASSRGSISDHFRSRTSSDSSGRISSVDRFRANSFDDDLESHSSPHRQNSSRSSDAGSSILAAELQRRDSPSQRDLVGATSIVPFVPSLRDEDIGDVKFDDLEAEPELVEMPFGVPGPSPYHVDFLGPTRTSFETLAYTLHYCDAPSSIETRIPALSEQPWSAPAGFLCVYESFFTECDLTFPIPGFLLEYVARREMALSQLSVAAIRNAVGLVRLASRCGVVVRSSHYEEVTKIKSLSKKKPGLYYVQSSTTPKLVDEAKSKTSDWSAGYFFVRISAESVEDVRIPIYTGWKISPARFPTIFDPFPEQLKKDLEKIRAEGTYIWPSTNKVARRPSRNPSRGRRGSSRRGPIRQSSKVSAPSKPGRKAMGKFDLSVVPDYASRYKEKRPATETPVAKPTRSEERQMREALKKSLLDQGGRHAFQAGSSRPLSPNSERVKKNEVLAARLTQQAGEGDRAVILPPSDDLRAVGARSGSVEPLNRKRPADTGARPIAQKRPRVADHRWSYRYVDRDVPFTSNADACAALFREMGHGPGSFPLIEDLRERDAYTEAARKSCEATFAMNRMVHLYERRVRRLSTENPNSSDYQAAIAAEKERVEQVSRELGAVKDEAVKLREKVNLLDHHRNGLIAERNRLSAEVEAEKARYDELAVILRSEKARLRERRAEYGEYCRGKALAKMARLFQARLTRLQAHVEDTRAAQPTLLLYNQAVGNLGFLKALVEDGEVVIKSEETLSRVEADVAQYRADLAAFDVTELQDGDFDAYTLFADRNEVTENLQYAASAASGRDFVGGDEVEEDAVDQDTQQEVAVEARETGAELQDGGGFGTEAIGAEQTGDGQEVPRVATPLAQVVQDGEDIDIEG
ncbi:meiosis-specific protein ASY2-like [Arabidopsis lyrata subsp. lyrata]|uniref:meiosis-specific protein ASY2-like n=1 Tax=Arabidopsis lyrata subsp. lyrata TaxID=81972 RepID=UPI000A29C7A3|nr:meiosis-specific protein ASY2-like [Arabidopsis lyrata subsp. lyrata]|eukprot:XP_020881843.1 meiosis-specific protein ASY2-like [Arabidopsis lyrata subsp. lyrata]